MFHKLLFILTALCFFFPALSRGQQQTQTQELNEEVEVSLVSVYLAAIDKKGEFVTDLRPGELSLLENGIPQAITRFSLISENNAEPLTVIILIDTSVSMNELYKQVSKLQMAKEAALMLLKELKPQDEMMLMTFSETPAEVTGFTSNRQLVEDKIRALKTDYGRTAVLDAVDVIVDKTREDFGRKIIFICSDGQDNASVNTTTAKVVEKLKATPDTIVITLGTTSFESGAKGLGDPAEIEMGKQSLQMMADATAGYAFFPKNLKDLAQIMEKLRRVVPSQYDLGYTPLNPILDGSWRTIQILCNRKGVKLQYRLGYFAK